MEFSLELKREADLGRHNVHYMAYDFRNGAFQKEGRLLFGYCSYGGAVEGGSISPVSDGKYVTTIAEAVSQKAFGKPDRGYWLARYQNDYGLEAGIDYTNKVIYLTVEGEAANVNGENDLNLAIATRVNLSKVVLVPIEDPASLRRKILDGLYDELKSKEADAGSSATYEIARTKEKITFMEGLDDNDPLLRWRPEMLPVDEEVITFDHRTPEFKVTVQRPGQEPRVMKRGEAYQYMTRLDIGGWFCHGKDPNLENGYYMTLWRRASTKSWKRILELLYQCPAIRQCWLEYGNLDMVAHLLNYEDKKSLSEQQSAAKTLGISKTAAKLVYSIANELKARGFSASCQNYINAAQEIKQSFNDQIAENFLSTVLSFVVEIPCNITMDYAEKNRYSIVTSSEISYIADMVLKYGGPKGKNYNVERLLQYLFYDVNTYQGIESPKEAFNLLRDYYRSLDISGIKIKDWFPHSLHLAHDVSARNARIAAKDYEEATFKAQTEMPNYQRLKYLGEEKKGDEGEDKKSDPYIVTIPSIPNDLVNEGAELHHCVGSYVKDVTNGTKMICFLREASAPDVPLVTLEVNPKTNTLVQYRGSCNRALSNEELKWVKKWCRIKGLRIVSC